MRARLLAAFVVLAGCSNQPVPPTITAVDGPMTSSAGQKITLAIQFQDPDDAVSAVKIAFPSTMQSTTTPLMTPVYTGAIINVGVTFPMSTPMGPFEIDLSLIDQSSVESAVKQVMVTIQ